ncbi:MAG: tryptophan 2,3-dioxygenase family protein [Bdellovibrionales bacterium]
MDLTYSQYLQLDKVLNAQKPQSDGEHDEMLFIIIHQSYELWFKQMIHEARYLQLNLISRNYHISLATIERILTILKTAVSQVDILETMTPISFASFRERLATSSGLQSWQFRVFEFVLGHKQARMMEFHKHDPAIYEMLKQQIQQPTLYDSLLTYLSTLYGIQISDNILKRDFAQNYERCDEVYNVIKEVYKNHPDLRILLEKFVDLDEGLQEWRYRHVKMVERTIGHKVGTGGSSGVEFLKNTLFRPLFPELWEVRSDF